MFRPQRRKGRWIKVVHLKIYCAYELPRDNVEMLSLKIQEVCHEPDDMVHLTSYWLMSILLVCGAHT